MKNQLQTHEVYALPKPAHGRIGYYVQIETLENALVLAEYGYTVTPIRGTYRAELPEIVLIDMSDLDLRYSYTAEWAIRAFKYAADHLTDLLARTRQFGVLRTVTGSSLGAQLRIAGNTAADLRAFRNLFHGWLRETVPGGNPDTLVASTPLRGSGVELAVCSSVTRELRRQIQSAYAPNCLNACQRLFRLYALNVAYVHPIWRQVAELSDHLVFVLHTGAAFAFGFVETTGLASSISFLELHRHQDPYAAFRATPLSYFLFPEPTERLSRALVVDTAFTGGTLVEAQKNLPGSRTFAISPQSTEAIGTSDYIYFNGSVLTREEAMRVIQESPLPWWEALFLESESRRQESQR